MFGFYIPGSSAALDLAVEKNAGLWVGRYSGKTQAELEQEYPGVLLLDLDEIERRTTEAATALPEEITAADFDSALEALPPVDWHNQGGVESFKLGELYSPGISVIYARKNGRFWRFRDLTTLRHDQIIERIMAAQSATEQA